MALKTLALTLLAATGISALPQAPAAAAASNSKAACSNIQLIIARGTKEPGTFGQYVGDPLYAATVAKFGSKTTVSGYAVNYPANFQCNSEALGVTDIVNHINSQSAQCPSQVFALVGYSQGADVLHNATIALNSKSPNICSKVVAVVAFGDPGNPATKPIPSILGGTTYPFPASYARKLKENCNPYGDLVCSYIGTNVTAHLSYADTYSGNFIQDSAAYIYNQYTTHGNSGPQAATYGGPNSNPPAQRTQANINALIAFGQSIGNTGSCT